MEFAKPLYGPKPVSRVRIPPSPPESFNLTQHKDLSVPAFSAQLHDPVRQKENLVHACGATCFSERMASIAFSIR